MPAEFKIETVETADVQFVAPWKDAVVGTPDEAGYSLRLRRHGDLCNVTGYIVGAVVPAGASRVLLTLPDGWDGGGSVGQDVSNNSTYEKVGLVSADGGTLYFQALHDHALAADEQLQVNYSWFAQPAA